MCDSVQCYGLQRPPPQAPLSLRILGNTGVGCHAVLQEMYLTQGSNLFLFCLLHWQVG